MTNMLTNKQLTGTRQAHRFAIVALLICLVALSTFAQRRERLVDEVRRDGIGLMGVPFPSLAPERPARRPTVKR